MRKPTLFALALLAASLVGAREAAAADDDGDTTLRYLGPAPKNYLRMSLEEVAILGAGLIQYFDTTGNSADWDLDYSWNSFSKKLTGEAVSFDTNRYDTNWVTHPGAGWLYYVAARGNRLSIPEAFLVTVAASTLWEYLGEFREQVSINDLLMTPVSGLVVGEVSTQLGAWFARGSPTVGNQIFAWLFGASNQLHDVIDGATPSRLSEQRGWHEFRLALGAATTQQNVAPSSSFDASAAIQSRIVRAPHYGKAGTASEWLTDANVSTVSFGATTSRGELVDAQFAAGFAFAGYYHQSVRASANDRLVGHGTYVGAGVGFSYGYHDYDRTGGGAQDRLAELDLLGLVLDHWLYFGAFRLHFGLSTMPAFAGPTSLALADYRSRFASVGLPSVAAEQGYYFAGGGVLTPSLELFLGPLGLRFDARLSAFRSIPGSDRVGPLDQVPLADDEARFGMRLSSRVGPFDVGTSVQRRIRDSHVSIVSRHYAESTLAFDTTLVF